MPGVSEFPPVEKVGEMLISEAAERRQQARRAWDYYEGNHVRHLRDVHVVVNLWSIAIDQSVSMLMGRAPTFEVVEGVTTDVEEAIRSVWEASQKDIMLHELALVGALTGHCFVKVWRRADGSVRVLWLDNVHVFWDESDPRRVLGYVYQPSENYRQEVVNLGNGTWQVTDRRRQGARWVTVGQPLVVPWRPIIDWQNLPNPRGYYGRPDLSDYERLLNDAVNFTASNVARILKYHAHPRTIIIGGRSSDVVSTSVDGVFTIPTPDAKVMNLEMQSDLASSLNFLQLLRSAFMANARAVDLSTMRDQVGRLTNFGLRVLFHHALEKLDTKRALYGAGLAEVCRQIALIETGNPEVNVNVHWYDPLPFNRAELVAALKDEVDLGLVSRETASRELGRDWETEQERMAMEAKGLQELSERMLEQLAQGGVPKV